MKCIALTALYAHCEAFFKLQKWLNIFLNNLLSSTAHRALLLLMLKKNEKCRDLSIWCGSGLPIEMLLVEEPMCAMLGRKLNSDFVE